jgi:hypothetical protein
VPDETPGLPGKPTITGVQPGNQRVIVSFDPPADDGGSPVTAYFVRTNQGQSTDSLDSPVTLMGLENGEPYTIAVAAANEVGQGPYSNYSAEVRPCTVPNPPAFLTATVDDGKTAVSFRAPGFDGGSPVTGYTVIARPGTQGSTPVTLDGQASPLTVTGLTNGITYGVSVVAHNVAGQSGPSAPEATVTPVKAPEPDEPWQPFPDCARFDIDKQINQAQLQDELQTALGYVIQLSMTRADPASPVAYLWIVPSSVARATVNEVIEAHVPDPNWGIPDAVRQYRDLVRRVVADPSITLTATELQIGVKGLISWTNSQHS